MFIESVVDDPKRLHPDTVLCKSFEEAKVFVEADLSKDSLKSFRFQSAKGVWIWLWNSNTNDYHQNVQHVSNVHEDT